MKSLANQTFYKFFILLAFFAFANFAFAFVTAEPAETENTIPESAQRPADENPLPLPERYEEANQKRIENQENIEQRQSEIREQVEDKKAQLEARSKERIVNLAANISNRMEALLSRLENIITRVESRIEKIKADNIDVSAAQSALDSAKISIAAARKELEQIDNEVNDAVNSEDVRGSWTEVKMSYQNAKDHIKTAHAELRSSLEALKDAVANAGYGNGASEAVRQNNEEVETSE